MLTRIVRGLNRILRRINQWLVNRIHNHLVRDIQKD